MQHTRTMEQVVTYIEKIVGAKLAYESNGSVYFDTAAFAKEGFAYRKLVPSHTCATSAEMEARPSIRHSTPTNLSHIP